MAASRRSLRVAGSRARALLLACALLASSALASSRAWAEPSDADRATARALAEEGNRALNAKDYQLAEDRFRRANALVRAPSLMVDRARALVGLQRYAEAYAVFDEARKEKLAPGAPQAFRRAVSDAERSIGELSSKIAWLTITVFGPHEPLVKLGDREIPVSQLGTKIPADIGTQSVSASAEGYLPEEKSVTLEAKESAEISLSLARAPVAPPPPAPAVKRVVRHTRPAPLPSPPQRSPSTLTYVAFGVGGAGLAVGAVTGVLFLGELSKLKTACPDKSRCTDAHDDVRRYYFYSYTSAVSLAVGVLGAGAGVALLLTAPKPEEKSSAVRVAPYVGIGNVGIEGSF